VRFAPAPAVPDRQSPPEVFEAIGEPLTLPAAWTAPSRPPLPVVAAVVPVVGAVGLWLVTGSVLSLWLAVLGPLIAGATVADSARSARRERRRHAVEAARAREQISQTISRRHDLERRRAWQSHPDVAAFLSRDDDVWRLASDRADALVAGSGDVASAVRLTGGGDDPETAGLRRRAASLVDAPVVIPASSGIVVVGPPVLAGAVQRALILQLCLALPPGELAVAAPAGEDFGWTARLPHVSIPGRLTLSVIAPGEHVPADADVPIARALPGEPLPPRCAAVLTVGSPRSASLQSGGSTWAVSVEAVSHDQAVSIGDALAVRAEQTLGVFVREPGPVALAGLTDGPPRGRDSLSAVIGIAGVDPFAVDLVADGPHAVVAGVTGSGKSELLITWILSLCRTRSPRDVVFLLADFKGGTAFDSLTAVPHVTGVITDLDGAGARRAIESLRAEIRAREAAIAGAGARDIADERVSLPRLVVVVDEFAALLGDHPELHAVFADVAARGRALGIHLVIGTQRAAGVIRESLLANCPLRISLRVTDAADSRAVLGSGEAALLSGGPEGRGQAYVRRAGDAAPRRVQIALSGDTDLQAVISRSEDTEIHRPWLPPLPSHVTLDETKSVSRGESGIVLALADEPARQRQSAVVVSERERGILVLGGSGSGLTNVIDLVAAQAGARAIRVPSDLERAWDAVASLAIAPPPPGSVVCVDDLDSLASGLPPDYAQVLIERIEGVVRAAGPGGYLVVASAHRFAGPALRVMELLPRRLRLGFPTRAEHVGAGGDAVHFVAGAPAGRGELDGLAVQVVIAPAGSDPVPTQPEAWHPDALLTGFVTRRSPAARAALAAWESRGVRSVPIDSYIAAPSLEADRLILVGEPDDWQRHWRLLADVRGDHDLVIDQSCAAELRLLTGTRVVPPYCEAGRSRAWLVGAGADPVRIVLPSAEVRPVRRTTHLDHPDAAP
jgi:S-DNA-T family DNA segregation ATPase FtsK/SpoIIIE